MIRSRQSTKFLILLFLLACITLGYAFVSTTLKIDGQANVLKQTWNVYWDEPVVTKGSIKNTPPTVTQDSGDPANTKLVWTVDFTTPGEFYEFTMEAVNAGTIDAMISNIDKGNTSIPEYINYSVTYFDGTIPTNGDVLKKRNEVDTRLKYKVRVYFDEDKVTNDDLDGIDKSYTFTVSIHYSQATADAYSGFALGDIVKYDPVSNSVCTSGSTCYEWNIIDVYDATLKENMTLQLDHNITPDCVIWISKADYNDDSTYGTYGNTSKGPITTLKVLESYTSGWDDSLKLNYTYDTSDAVNNYGVLNCVNGVCKINDNPVTTNLKARIITGEEMAAITVAGGADKGTIAYNWTQASSNVDEWYFFSRNNKVIGTLDDMPSGKKSSTRLKWLVKNTTASSISGATGNAWGSSTGGYWTLTPVSNDPTHAWSIGGSSYEPYNGNIGAYYVGNSETYGLRPVITIPKSILTN